MPARALGVSAEEYLEGEARADIRHEFVDGQLFAMVGATAAHNKIAGNVFSLLHSQLRDSNCTAYIADMKLRIEATNSFYYPDVMVSCSPFKAKSLYETSPVLVVEVLSPSTAEIDRREKLFAYRHVNSLQEYIVVSQDEKLVELYRKDSRGEWGLEVVRGDAEFVLNSVRLGQLRVPLNSIYEGTGL